MWVDAELLAVGPRSAGGRYLGRAAGGAAAVVKPHEPRILRVCAARVGAANGAGLG